MSDDGPQRDRYPEITSEMAYLTPRCTSVIDEYLEGAFFTNFRRTSPTSIRIVSEGVLRLTEAED